MLPQIPLTYMMSELFAIADEIDINGTNVTASGMSGTGMLSLPWLLNTGDDI